MKNRGVRVQNYVRQSSSVSVVMCVEWWWWWWWCSRCFCWGRSCAGGGDASAASQIFYDAFHAKFGHGSGGAIAFTTFACISLFFGNITNVTLTARMVLLTVSLSPSPHHIPSLRNHNKPEKKSMREKWQHVAGSQQFGFVWLLGLCFLFMWIWWLLLFSYMELTPDCVQMFGKCRHMPWQEIVHCHFITGWWHWHRKSESQSMPPLLQWLAPSSALYHPLVAVLPSLPSLPCLPSLPMDLTLLYLLAAISLTTGLNQDLFLLASGAFGSGVGVLFGVQLCPFCFAFLLNILLQAAPSTMQVSVCQVPFLRALSTGSP